eukprot:Platyproteum_vivax@DN2950_c0_g1_i2.p1
MKYDIEGVNTRMDVCLIHCCWYIDDRIGSRYLLSSYTSLAMASTSPASLAWTTFAMPSSFFVKASLEEAYTILSFTLAVSGDKRPPLCQDRNQLTLTTPLANAMASGVQVNQKCIDEWDSMKIRKTHKYIIFKIDNLSEIVVEKS